MTSEELLDFLEITPLFKGVGREDLRSILPLLSSRMVAANTELIHEGNPGAELFLILSGSLEVFRKENNTSHRLALLGKGEWFGEMSLMEKKERTASVRSLTKAHLLSLKEDDLKRLFQKPVDASKIALNLASMVAQRLRKTNEKTLQLSKHNAALLTASAQTGRLIIFLVISFCFYSLILKFLGTYGPNSQPVYLTSLFLVGTIASVSIWLVKKTSYSLEFYGLTTKRWKASAKEGILWTLPILALTLLLKWFLIKKVAAFAHMSLFEWKPSVHDVASGLSWRMLLYLLFVPLQEFIVRGCLQSSLENFFRSRRRTLLAIITSNLLFGIFHELKALPFVLVAFLLGLFWGWLYSRHRSLVGVSLSHLIISIWGFAGLNFAEILNP